MDSSVNRLTVLLQGFTELATKTQSSFNSQQQQQQQQRKVVQIFYTLNHKFKRKIINEVTFCSQCNDLIWFPYIQQCSYCKLSCHKRCLRSVKYTCGVKQVDTSNCIDKHSLASNNQHLFKDKTFLSPTYCNHCGTLLVGFFKQGLICQKKNCSFIAHKNCVNYVTTNCGSIIAKQNVALEKKRSSDESAINNTSDINKFKLIKPISSQGSFGKVFLAKLKDEEEEEETQANNMTTNKQHFIIKIQNVSDIDREEAYSERQILLKLKEKDRFFTKLYCDFYANNEILLVMHFEGPSLRWFLKNKVPHSKVDDQMAKFCAAEIAVALRHLHKLDIIHCDLKTENVVITASGHLKIIDFGLSMHQLTDKVIGGIRGTLHYMSPEMADCKIWSFPVDWWALGILLFELVFGETPYDEYSGEFDSEDEFLNAIIELEIDFAKLKCSSKLSSVLEGLLNKDPLKRLNGDTIHVHPFFKEIDWNQMECRSAELPYLLLDRPNLQESVEQMLEVS